jgi:hypothetical protein
MTDEKGASEMADVLCNDNRFEIIARAKEDLLESTNIETDEAEMAVIDNILFRCWQMGWLDRYDHKTEPQTEQAVFSKAILTSNNGVVKVEPQTETKWLQREGDF